MSCQRAGRATTGAHEHATAVKAPRPPCCRLAPVTAAAYKGRSALPLRRRRLGRSTHFRLSSCLILSPHPPPPASPMAPAQTSPWSSCTRRHTPTCSQTSTSGPRQSRSAGSCAARCAAGPLRCRSRQHAPQAAPCAGFAHPPLVLPVASPPPRVVQPMHPAARTAARPLSPGPSNTRARQDASGFNTFWGLHTSSGRLALPPYAWAPLANVIDAEGAANVGYRRGGGHGCCSGAYAVSGGVGC